MLVRLGPDYVSLGTALRAAGYKSLHELTSWDDNDEKKELIEELQRVVGGMLRPMAKRLVKKAKKAVD